MTQDAGRAPMRPACSIVVAARGDEHDPTACLRSLEGQVGPDVEVILVTAGHAAGWPGWVRHIRRPDGLMAELWAEGLAEATGEVVGITSAGVVPGPDWLSRARLVANGHEAALGGPIEPGEAMGLVDWAVYFCRYAPYMLPLLDPDRLEVPGDNAVYQADLLARYRSLWNEAFWEPFVHRAMRADGHALAFDPGLVVQQTTGASLGGFARQRFRHGRVYGHLRSMGVRRRSTLRAAAAAPLVPAVMTARAGRHVYAKRRHRGPFLRALPLVLLFYCCWAAGELVGRLSAAFGPASFRRATPLSARR